MAQSNQNILSVRERRYPGEPLALNELEQVPYLRPVAKSIRDVIHANKTLRDIDLQNKQSYEDFMDLCNHNLVFYLKITHQYYLLETLFKDPELSEEWQKFLEDVREYERKQHQQQYQQQLQQQAVLGKTDTSSVPLTQESSSSPFEWTHPHHSLSNVEKREHYEKELQRITVDYYQQKIQLYSDSARRDLALIDEALEELDGDEESKASPKYQEVRAIRQEYAQKIESVLAQNLLDEGGNVDVKLAKKQAEDLESLKKEMNERISTLCQPKTSNSRLNETLNKLTDKLASEKENLHSSVDKLDTEFQRAHSELTEKIKEHHTEAKKEVDEELEKLIQTLSSTRSSDLTVNQKEQLPRLIDEIRTYREKLAASDNPEEYKSLLSEMLVKVKTDSQELPSAMKQKIDSIIDPVGDMYNLSSDELEKKASINNELEIPQVLPVASMPNLDHLEPGAANQPDIGMKQEVHFDEWEPGAAMPQDVAMDILDEFEPGAAVQPDQPLEHDSNPQEFEPGAEILPDKSNEHQNASAIEKQRLMKAQVKQIKQQEQQENAANNLGAEPKLEEMSTSLMNAMSLLKNKNFTSDEQHTVSEITRLLGLLQKMDYQENTEEAFSLLTEVRGHFDDISEHVTRSKPIGEKIDAVLEQLEITLEEQESMKKSMR